MNTIYRLIQFYNSGAPDEIYREATGNLLRYLHEIADLSIYELAEKCFVSPTTISRLCRKLGFLNYTDFKNSISGDVRGYFTLNRSIPYISVDSARDVMDVFQNAVLERIESLRANLTAEALDEAVEKMGNCNRIVFYANCMIDPSFFQEDLLMSGKISYYINGAERALVDTKNLASDTLVISFLPKVPKSNEMLPVFKAVKEAGAAILLLSSATEQQFAKYADYLFSYQGTGTAIDKYAAIYFFDLLTVLFRHKYIDIF